MMKVYLKNVAVVTSISLISTLLLGCDKPANMTATKPASIPTSTTSSTTASTTISAVSSTATILPASAVTATTLLPISAPTTTSVPTKTDNATRKSLITQSTAPNTPEDVLKKSLDALMAGNAKEAAQYYHVEGIDMAQMLTQQVPVVQKQLKHLEISPTQYNADKTKAGIIGKLTLANSKQPKQTLYKFENLNGEWKIVE